jgi:hypothetical protein
MSAFILAAEEAAKNPVVEWMAAIGSVGAAIIPLIFFLIERKDRRLADKRREEAEKRSQEQAEYFHEVERLHARMSEERAEEAMNRRLADVFHVWVDGVGDDMRFKFSNPGLTPVQRIRIKGQLLLAPQNGGPIVSQEDKVQLDLVPPTGREPLEYTYGQLYRPSLDEVPDGHTIHGFQIRTVVFVDAGGREWERNPALATLTLHSEQQAPGSQT